MGGGCSGESRKIFPGMGLVFSNPSPITLHKSCILERGVATSPLYSSWWDLVGFVRVSSGGGSGEGVLGLPPGWTVLARTGWESEVLIFQDLGEFSWRSISNPLFIHSLIHS